MVISELTSDKAYILRDGQKPVETKPENGRSFTLKELYAKLNCKTVQVIRIDSGFFMIMDEEGKYTKLPNDIATALAATVLFPGDFIVGDVIICPPKMFR